MASSDVVIRISNLGKKYTLGGSAPRGGRFNYRRLSDVVIESARGSLQGLRRLVSTGRFTRGEPREEFWALRNVEFEVKRGEVIGIIGRNGAGKSTLLKVLSRITEPTTGCAEIDGRLASLLEVGTGFHPELTGRENIFLNGAILGMPRRQIAAKFDEIVAFAEVAQFIDTPVKFYSSGMYVRLAFAVAAHLEPDILVVDEVLAVGDAEFQKKCLGKIGDAAFQGRTVLFVSHDIGNVTRLSHRAIVLNKGQVEYAGNVGTAVGRYLQNGVEDAAFVDLNRRGDRSGSGDARAESLELLSEGTRCSVFPMGAPATFRVVVRVDRSIGLGRLAITLATDTDIAVLCLENTDGQIAWKAEPGRFVIDVTLPQVTLYPGRYGVEVWLGDPSSNRVDLIKRAAAFQVIQTSELGATRTLERNGGLVHTVANWRIQTTS